MKKLLIMTCAATAERDAATEKLRLTVRNLKEIGMPAEQILKVTGLTADEINAM